MVYFFLDELPEFNRSVLEVLRQPLEERTISIARTRVSQEFPANFMLVASMNPCPCGYYGHSNKECTCEVGQVNRYLNKVSGPLLDRIDLHLSVGATEFKHMIADSIEEDSSVIRERVIKARAVQTERYKGKSGIYTNAQMTSKQLRKFCTINQTSTNLLAETMKHHQLSARAYDRILKVSRTIADMAGSEQINDEHISEAVEYRCLDKEGWGKTRKIVKLEGKAIEGNN